MGYNTIMKNVKTIKVTGSFQHINDTIVKLAKHEHIKDKSVHMRYMGGKSCIEGIEAEIKFYSDDNDKIETLVESA